MMRSYRRRQSLVQAAQVNEQTVNELATEVGGVIVKELDPHDSTSYRFGLTVPTVHGNIRVSEPDWIVKDWDGKLRKMTDYEFQQEFEPITRS